LYVRIRGGGRGPGDIVRIASHIGIIGRSLKKTWKKVIFRYSGSLNQGIILEYY
jgi:hypothetical protein